MSKTCGPAGVWSERVILAGWAQETAVAAEVKQGPDTERGLADGNHRSHRLQSIGHRCEWEVTRPARVRNELTVLMFQGRDWLQGQCRRSTLSSLVKDQMQSECM